tara:strand:+ start:2959 stop:3147 length:189 start_codon:yes stop_codon:yes gene_type:complete
MRLFLTEYEKDGKSCGGPFIIASSWEEAEQQALDFNVTVIGEISAFGELAYDYKLPTKRVLH